MSAVRRLGVCRELVREAQRALRYAGKDRLRVAHAQRDLAEARQALALAEHAVEAEQAHVRAVADWAEACAGGV